MPVYIEMLGKAAYIDGSELYHRMSAYNMDASELTPYEGDGIFSVHYYFQENDSVDDGKF